VAEWGFAQIIPNTKNPQVGAILSQTYVRQVLAHLTDQTTMIDHFMGGYGIPTYGPTPVAPKGNAFISPSELSNPYPYSVSKAESILKKHGWQVNPGKVDVCLVAGPAGCGAGVAKGEKLSLNMLYASGSVVEAEDADLFQSDAAQAGVQISTRAAAFNTVVSQVQPCILPKDKGTPTCNWQLGEYGVLGLSTYPSGEGVFNTGGAFNAGQYSNPTMDKLINESTYAPGLTAYHEYENLVVQQEPWIWQPLQDHLAATVKNLTGYGLTSEFDGYRGYIEPNFWAFTK
jgi:peptide/nickel transport system substrate-binding protein